MIEVSRLEPKGFGVSVRVSEQGIDQVTHPFSTGDDPFDVRVSGLGKFTPLNFFEDFREAGDRTQRGPQLVRCAVVKVLQPDVALFQSCTRKSKLNCIRLELFVSLIAFQF